MFSSDDLSFDFPIELGCLATEHSKFGGLTDQVECSDSTSPMSRRHITYKQFEFELPRNSSLAT